MRLSHPAFPNHLKRAGLLVSSAKPPVNFADLDGVSRFLHSQTAQAPRTDAARMVNPRRAERYSTSVLTCQFGKVLDVSATGMRVDMERAKAAKVEPGQVVKLTVASPMQKLNVTGQVVWVKKRLLMGATFAVRFIDVTPTAAKVLVELAQYGFVEVGKGSTSNGSSHGAASGAKAHSTAGAAPQASIEIEDYYGALAVSPEASEEDIHEAYRVLAKSLHPDVNKEPGAEQRFAFVTKAYATLKDPLKKEKYDQVRSRAGVA